MRADKFCTAHYGSRTKAAEAILRGEVLVNGRAVKPADEVNESDEVTFLQPFQSFVSNGGAKLARAIDCFHLKVEGLIFADIGASTGGFTDCLLQNGAKKVYCVDVGESLLSPKLQADERVISIENTNARYLTTHSFADILGGIVIDVSFIPLELILPVLSGLLPSGGIVLALIKPQFECDNKRQLSKSGLVTDRRLRRKIVEKVYDVCIQNRLYPQDLVNAPLRERKNVEYVIYLKKDATKFCDKRTIGNKADKLL